MALQSIVPQLKLILWSYGEAYSNSGTNAKVKTSDRGPNDVLLYHIVLTFIKLFPVWRTETSLVIWDGIDLYLYTIYIYIAIIQYIYIVCVYIYMYLPYLHMHICIYVYIRIYIWLICDMQKMQRAWNSLYVPSVAVEIQTTSWPWLRAVESFGNRIDCGTFFVTFNGNCSDSGWLWILRNCGIVTPLT